MSRLALSALGALALAAPLTACQRSGTAAPPAAAPSAAASQAAASAPPSAAPSVAKAAASAAAKAGGHGRGGPEIKWAGPIAWTDYASGLAEAKATGRNVCLVLYADWCPRCRELAPVFAEPDVVEAAKGLVMVRANSDLRTEWMQRYAHLGSYVPRVFFLDPNGTVISDIKASHPRYPYFYAAGRKAELIASLRAAQAPAGAK